MMTAHDRWQVFWGDSEDPFDLIFSVKRSSMLQLKTKLLVYLANNRNENVCDYKVEGSWFEKSCIIYAGESSTVVAQVRSPTLKSGSRRIWIINEPKQTDY